MTMSPELLGISCCQEEVQQYRSEHHLFIHGSDPPKPVTSFKEANFPEYISRTLMKQGFGEPTPIQAQGWPMALSGRDFVGIAQTGSGKTIGVMSETAAIVTSVVYVIRLFLVVQYVLPGLVHIHNQPVLEIGDGPIVSSEQSLRVGGRH